MTDADLPDYYDPKNYGQQLLPTLLITAYHGSPTLKVETLAQVQAHYDADELVQGVYADKRTRKYCAVGCLTHDPDGGHAEYPLRWGIPESLAHLEDRIFEALPKSAAKEWPLRFMGAIPVGADLSRIEWQFKHRLLTDAAITPGITHELVRDAIAAVAALCERAANGDTPTGDEWSAARNAARSAAESAARSAAESAWRSAWSAWRSAAESAAESAWRSAAESAERSAWSAAEGAAYVKMANILIELIQNAPVPA